MAALNISIPHHLSQEEALQRVKGLIQQVRTQHADKVSDVSEEWAGHVGRFSFSAMGFPVSGTMSVEPTELRLSAELPFAASFFKPRIESAVRERAAELLA